VNGGISAGRHMRREHDDNSFTVSLSDRNPMSGHLLLSRGAPPPLVDASHAARFPARVLAWPPAPITFSRGPTPARPPHGGRRDGDPRSLMPRTLRASPLACWHGRRRLLLSRGAPPPHGHPIAAAATGTPAR